jgi:hypothetical protein
MALLTEYRLLRDQSLPWSRTLLLPPKKVLNILFDLLRPTLSAMWLASLSPASSDNSFAFARSSLLTS